MMTLFLMSRRTCSLLPNMVLQLLHSKFNENAWVAANVVLVSCMSPCCFLVVYVVSCFIC
jgi:hypothetical protein